MNNQNAHTHSPQSGNKQSGPSNKQGSKDKMPGQQSGTKANEGSASDRKDSPGTGGRESGNK